MVKVLDQNPANMDPNNADNALNLYKEAYQFEYLYYARILKDKEKAAASMEKFKTINDLLTPAE